jgi:solute carrier family 10 (sodium/bile acid cotransporter), member 7
MFLLVLVWSTFCNQFASGVFSRVSKETIILVAFLNVALYLFMSLVCLWAARPPFPSRNGSLLPLFGHDSKEPALVATLRRLVKKATFGKRETAAVCFCGAAKGAHSQLEKTTLTP